MKKRVLLSTVGPVLFLMSSMSSSQTKAEDTIVTVPSSFVVANQELPPGRYIVTSIAQGVLRIYSSQSPGVAAPVHTTEGKGPETSGKVVFHRYGNTYFLSGVWTAGNDTGKQLFRSKAEKEGEMRHGKSELAVLRTKQ